MVTWNSIYVELYIPHECERSIKLRNMQGVARGAISSHCGIVSNVGPFIRHRLDRRAQTDGIPFSIRVWSRLEG